MFIIIFLFSFISVSEIAKSIEDQIYPDSQNKNDTTDNDSSRKKQKNQDKPKKPCFLNYLMQKFNALCCQKHPEFEDTAITNVIEKSDAISVINKKKNESSENIENNMNGQSETNLKKQKNKSRSRKKKSTISYEKHSTEIKNGRFTISRVDDSNMKTDLESEETKVPFLYK